MRLLSGLALSVAAIAYDGVGATTTASIVPTVTAQAAAPATADPDKDATAGHEPDGFWTGPVNDPVPATIAGGKVIHAQDLEALLKHGGGAAVVVDVSDAPRRPASLPESTWMPLPHQAIPGAIWIPGAGLGTPAPPVEDYFRQRLATATRHDMGRLLVLYCHEKCWLSWNAAKRAIRYGYKNVYWFPDGIEGWRKAKLPIRVITPEPVP